MYMYVVAARYKIAGTRKLSRGHEVFNMYILIVAMRYYVGGTRYYYYIVSTRSCTRHIPRGHDLVVIISFQRHINPFPRHKNENLHMSYLCHRRYPMKGQGISQWDKCDMMIKLT